MPDAGQFDLDYRPTTYWGGMTRATANIKGTFRREMLQGAAALEGLPPELLAPSLGDELRTEVGAWHPSYMAGEYLPDHGDSEVTIARIEMESVTGDAIGIRARPTADGIAYRVVDEYETPFRCSPTTSAQPLSMGQLVALIDSISDDERTDLLNWLRDYQLDGEVSPADAVDFVRVVSDFYPQLEAWYAAEAAEWLERRRAAS